MKNEQLQEERFETGIITYPRGCTGYLQRRMRAKDFPRDKHHVFDEGVWLSPDSDSDL